MKYPLVTFTLIATVLSGCHSIASSPALLNASADGNIQFVDFPTERRGAWIVKTEVTEGDKKITTYKVCAEPPPDAGISTAQLLTIAAELKKVNTSLDSSISSSLVELKGRTPAVLALRDVMYRQCESRLLNGKASVEDIEIYKEIVKVIADFAKADLASAEEQKAKATGNIGAFERARAFESAGYAALGKRDWGKAQEAFESCEVEQNSFRACYELARAIRINKEDSNKAIAILKYRGYLPTNLKNDMEALSKKIKN